MSIVIIMEMVDNLKQIDENLIDVFNEIAKGKIEYWDLRCAVTMGTTLDFTDQKSKEISSFEVNNCGIRTFVNGGWGFSVLKEISKPSMISSFRKAIKLAQLSESLCENKFKIKERDGFVKNFKIECKENLENIDIEDKIELVKYHEKNASSFSPKIKNTRTFYFDRKQVSLYLNTFRSYICQDLSLLRFVNLVYTQENGLIQRSLNSIGGLGGFEITKTEEAKNLSSKTAKEAVDLLNAKSPVGGKFTVIMDPTLTGTFIHEALGHACEADEVLNKESILEGKINEKVAQDNITIIDNPTMGQGKKYDLPYELYGCYFVDSEGIPSQKTIIIENGIFKNYLHNLETSSRMSVPPNGHGRASSSSSRPLVRMGVTILEPGDWDLEEMIKDTKNGIICEDFQYGYTDPTTGNFQFKCKISYNIENGEKGEMMRDVALSGMTLEVLNKISAIGKKISYSDGMCGKSGQRVRVCDGGPYVRIDNLTVGGLN